MQRKDISLTADKIHTNIMLKTRDILDIWLRLEVCLATLLILFRPQPKGYQAPDISVG